MRPMVLMAALVAMWFAGGWAAAVECRIAPDRMAEVGGNRVFVLGLYETPKSDEIAQAIAAAGFNLAFAGESKEALDLLQRNGLFGWVNTGARIDLSVDADARLGQLKELAAAYAGHPAMLVWEVPDEALWNVWYGAMRWRTEFEPQQQKPLIDALTDAAAAEALRGDMAKVQSLWREGAYAQAEALADGIWAKLGQPSPQPGNNLSNAAERAAAMAQGMRQGYSALKQADAQHPVWMNHAPRNSIAQLAAFNYGADIAGCDIYPVPQSPHQGHSDLAETTVVSVGAYTDRMQAAAPGKPVWMVLQGFGWADIQPNLTEERKKELRRPTIEETRFMAYDSIVHGARGLLYWGTAYIEKDSACWKDLLTVSREMADLQPLLSAADHSRPVAVSQSETFGSVDRGVRVLAKDVEGTLWFIVVNEWNAPLEYTLRFEAGDPATRSYRDTYSGQDLIMRDGKLTTRIAGHGVQVLKPKD